MKVDDKVYVAQKDFKRMIDGYTDRGYTDLTFSGKFWSGKQELNTILETEVGSVALFSRIMRGHIKSENPDRFEVVFFGVKHGDKILLGKKTSQVPTIPGSSIPAGLPETETDKTGFKGLGEAEVMNLVDRKVLEREKEKDLFNLREEVANLRQEKKDLLLKNEELEERFGAQNNIKAFAEIAGKAAPIITAIFGNHPIAASAVSLLSGHDKEGSEKKEDGDPPPDENKKAIIRLISEFLLTLNDVELAGIYTIMANVQEDKSLISTLKQKIAQAHGKE